MNFNFKVGQKYMLRDDRVGTVTVVGHNDGNYPIIIETREGPISVTYEGRYSLRNTSSNDVIKLIKDVNLITMDKKYVDRKGNPVQVLTTTLKNPHYPVVIVETRASDGVEFVRQLTSDGMYFHNEDAMPY